MKKNIVLLVLASLLGLGAWYSYRQSNRKSTLEKLDLNFSVSDTASIDRIVLEPVQGEKADLVRQSSGGWMLNGKYKVAPVLMDVLLSTIRNLEMLRPLAKNEAGTAIESMEKRGRKVSVYVQGSLYKAYRLGDDAPGNKGTYIQLEEGDPYVAYLRGFNGFLNPRFDVTENEWRDRLLFACKPSDVKSLKLEYRRVPAESYQLTVSGRYIQLLGAGRFDTAAAAQVLSSFQRIFIERYLDRMPKSRQDSLLQAGFEWALELESAIPAQSATLQFFLTTDPDRSLAYLPRTREWVTIQNRALYPIMQRKSALLNP